MKTLPLSLSLVALIALPALFGTGRLEAQKDPKSKGGPALFANRKGEAREAALREHGGDEASEKAVAAGLKWLAAKQKADGSWAIEGFGEPYPAGATALALLPFLADGKTHKPAKGNPYDKAIARGLNFLVKRQDPKTGFFGGTMYEHGLATIAVCEAFGMTQDQTLRPAALRATNLILNTQHATTGGWDYAPNNTSKNRDMSISGIQITALKTAQAAGFAVPKVGIDRARTFLDKVRNDDEGYGYVPGGGSTPRMSAAGVLSRQQLENWGPENPQLSKAVKKFLTANPPDRADSYYCYYATQVMFNVGGDDWKTWNEKMRAYLLKKQDTSKANGGSWGPEGDPYGNAGGRLMVTSFHLLSLQIYYRYPPLGDRAAKKD